MSSSFWSHARTRPEALALVEPGGTTYTFRETADLAGRVATLLHNRGLRPGDTVSLIGRNEPLWMVVYLAALQSGLYFTPLSPSSSPAEVATVWRDAEPACVVAGRGAEALVAEVADELGITADMRLALAESESLPGLGNALTALPATAASPPVRAGVRALYTGGTTGAPKCVRRPLPTVSPEEAAQDITRMPRLLGMPEGESRHLVAGPLYHGGPLAYATAGLHLGSTLVLLPSWSAEAALQAVEQYRVNSTFMVPTMLTRLVNLPDETRLRYDLSSLNAVIHGAAPCPPPLKRRLIEWLGPVLYEFYAATEGGGTYVSSEEWARHPGTVGRPFPGADVKITDADGAAVPPRTIGRITMRSHNGSGSDYFWPGDLGYVDEEGWLFLTDRVSDVIITGGVNVYSSQVEAQLMQLRSIEQCAVIGVPDPDWGEAVTAVFVQSSTGGPGPTDEGSLHEFAASVLAPPQRPKRYVRVEALPLTAAGKVDKKALRARYRDLVESAGEA